ncbi:MAG: hypothetical protein KGL39_26195 [Patescibacteria group bacterium]|nr:hypothetical protein [Patescibacteria group bacterium]
MANFLKIEVQHDSSLVTARSHNQIMGRLFRQAMQHHKEQVLPRHFEKVPETEPGGAYGYAPRSRRWKKRKAREGKDPDRPLVYTGLMRTIALRESVVRATKDGGSLTARNHYPMTDQRRREVENFSNRELARLVGRMKIDYLALARSPQYARQRQRRIMVT